MSTPAINPFRVAYGTSGQETVQKMEKSLLKHSLNITYDSSSQKFTVLGSANYKKEKIERVLKNNYFGWQPKVLDELDGAGNRLVSLVPIENRSSKTDRVVRTNCKL